MNLDSYLKRDGAESMAELARRLGLHADQLRQWRHQQSNRKPSPQNCVALERATGRLVRRWNLRPDDWHVIWPELIGTEGAPAVAVGEVSHG